MEIRHIKFKFLNFTVHVYFELDKESEDINHIMDNVKLQEKSEQLLSPNQIELKLLIEKTINLGNTYSARLDYDKSHQPPNPDKTHIHVFKNGNELFAINRDGTAHDGWHDVEIPGAIFNVLKNKFSDFNFPATRIIENVECDNESIQPLSKDDLNLEKMICQEIDNMDFLKKNIIP